MNATCFPNFALETSLKNWHLQQKHHFSTFGFFSQKVAAGVKWIKRKELYNFCCSNKVLHLISGLVHSFTPLCSPVFLSSPSTGGDVKASHTPWPLKKHRLWKKASQAFQIVAPRKMQTDDWNTAGWGLNQEYSRNGLLLFYIRSGPGSPRLCSL